MDEILTLDSDSASDIFPNFNLDLFPRLLEESNDNLSLELSISSDGKKLSLLSKKGCCVPEICMVMNNW